MLNQWMFIPYFSDLKKKYIADDEEKECTFWLGFLESSLAEREREREREEEERKEKNEIFCQT